MSAATLRYSGILAHPTSFPSPYGIGDLGKGAYEFIDFLAVSGQSIWQVLPLGPTGYGDSPYQAFSSFAGQPLLISPDLLIREGLLHGEDVQDVVSFDPNHIYYGSIIPYKWNLLKKSHAYFMDSSNLRLLKEYDLFCTESAEWLDDYALFMAGKDYHNGAAWSEWKDDLRNPNEEIKAAWNKKLAGDISFYKYVQFLFFRQWEALRKYAAVNNITIVGDIPIFTAYDSADVWANRKLFLLDPDGYPSVVAGVPPDYFSATGQLWGNPLYDWKYHKKTKYDWWMKRIAAQLKLVDLIRIDHFRGFEQYYAIPFASADATKGKWQPGPGASLFEQMQKTFGDDLPVWAEDLGIITPEVEELRDRFQLPGMKVLQFAFDNPLDNDLMPHNYTTTNSICYTGTHDNNTALGWYQNAKPIVQDRIRRYLNTDARVIHHDMIRCAMGSICRYCVIPIQDILGLGSDCRMNIPSTPSGNWAFRYRFEHLSPELAMYLRSMTELFGRCEPLPTVLDDESTEENEDLEIEL